MRRLTRIAALGALIFTGAPAISQATGIAYIKDGQVWVSTLDGAKKVQLSDGPAWWNAVGQSSNGGIVATKNEPGKIFQLSQFRVWNPDGSVKDDGPASPGLNFSGSLAMPLGLELTADNRGIIYGFSHMTFAIPVSFLTQGFALLPTDTRTSPTSTFTATDLRWPSLVSGRLIGSDSSNGVVLENAGGNNTSGFTTWPGLSFNGIADAKLHGVQAADSGQLLTAQIDIDPSSTPQLDDANVHVIKTTGLLGSYVDDCLLPSVGLAQSSDIAADGSLVAWSDEQGLKLAPPPNLRSGGPADCDMTGATTLIDPGGKSPAFGPIDVDALYAARNPAPPAPTQTTTTTTPKPPATTLTIPAPGKPPVVAIPSGLAASTLASTGTTVQVAAGRKGTVKVTVTVSARSVGRKGKAILIASGSATLKSAGQVAVKLRPTKLGKKFKKRLKGKKVSVVIKAAGKTTRRTITLK